jgi:hypothetical protein
LPETWPASKEFELSQTLRQPWLTADYDASRRTLEIVCLNFTLDGATLVPEIRKPFDVLAEGLLTKNSRGDWTPLELFLAGILAWKPRLGEFYCEIQVPFVCPSDWSIHDQDRTASLTTKRLLLLIRV